VCRLKHFVRASAKANSLTHCTVPSILCVCVYVCVCVCVSVCVPLSVVGKCMSLCVYVCVCLLMQLVGCFALQ